MYNESITELLKRVRELKQEEKKKQKELSDIQSDIELIEGLIKLKKTRKSSGHYTHGISKDEIPKSYTNDLFHEQKVIFILHKLREATIREIADFMQKMEKDEDYEGLYKRAQQKVITLSKKYKIIKIGNKNYGAKYKLNLAR